MSQHYHRPSFASFIVLATRFCARVILHASRKLPRTDGRHLCASTREAERRTAHLVQEPHPENSKVRAWPRPDKRDRSPFGAPPRSCARDSPSPTRPGPRFLESPDPNGRTLSGTSAASTSQSDHAPDGTMPKPPARQERRTPLAGTAPAPSVGVFRLTSLTLSGIGADIQIAAAMSKRFYFFKEIGILRGVPFARRRRIGLSLEIKICKKRSYGCQLAASAIFDPLKLLQKEIRLRQERACPAIHSFLRVCLESGHPQ